MRRPAFDQWFEPVQGGLFLRAALVSVSYRGASHRRVHHQHIELACGSRPLQRSTPKSTNAWTPTAAFGPGCSRRKESAQTVFGPRVSTFKRLLESAFGFCATAWPMNSQPAVRCMVAGL